MWGGGRGHGEEEGVSVTVVALVAKEMHVTRNVVVYWLIIDVETCMKGGR